MFRTRYINKPGLRRCRKCCTEFPLNGDNFHHERGRLFGFGYLCKSCANAINRTKPQRSQRWDSLTPTQKISKRTSQLKNYLATPKSVHRIRSYRAIDKKKGQVCDLDADWYEQNIQGKSCEYCGDKSRGVGCDRIDNLLGHTKANVVPCCLECNIIRGNRFSYDEMLIIGEGIRKVRISRYVTGKTLAQVRAAFEAGKPFV